uniref:EGF-like module-containing mucin-like hormone receptor-like 2 n=1 Tax=Phallusia mammillata TaxID=59560 RepID=A0A6F9DBV1_9ASCI|nr:EGF-like module-containing mucin-like hormone receptor-like 2 [Phallusia mammillata]
MCWVHNYSLYIGFLLIIGLILLNNIVVLVLVVRHVRTMENKVQSSAASRDFVQQMKMVFTMSVTFGLTWVIGFLMLLSDDEKYLIALSWLFTIFNAFLGVFIFYTSAVMRKEIFEMWTRPCTKRTRTESTSNGTGRRLVSNPSESEASQTRKDTRV